MNSFISNLLDRHLDTERNVRPRVRGRFDAVPDLSGIMTGEDHPGLEKDESPQAQPAPLPREWKNQLKSTVAGSKTDGAPETAGEKNTIPPHTSLFVPGIIEKKEEKEQQPVPVKITVEPLLQIKNEPGENKNQLSTPQERIIHRLQRKYLEKIYLIKTSDKKEQDHQPGNPVEPAPVFSEQDNTLLIDEMTREEAGNEEQLTVSPLVRDSKRKREHRLPGSVPGAGTTQVINVSIGRVEVRASFPPVETRTITKKENTGILSLEQYLDQRKPGKR